MKLRCSKSEIDMYVSRLKKKGATVITDKVQGNTRTIELTTARVIFTSNGWLEIQMTDKKSTNSPIK